ncbi:hypothetical protein [Streptomyces niveus]|uniref:hypothetical protein n=1 Tax=Streptomyces niveus TaxID=193462 RepID=UPI0036A464C1
MWGPGGGKGDGGEIVCVSAGGELVEELRALLGVGADRCSSDGFGQAVCESPPAPLLPLGGCVVGEAGGEGDGAGGGAVAGDLRGVAVAGGDAQA